MFSRIKDELYKAIETGDSSLTTNQNNRPVFQKYEEFKRLYETAIDSGIPFNDQDKKDLELPALIQHAIKSNQPNTAVFFYAEFGRSNNNTPEKFKLLVQMLFWAIDYENQALIKWLLKPQMASSLLSAKLKNDTDKYKQNETPFHFAVRKNNITIIKLLIEKSADFDFDPTGIPLEFVSEESAAEILKIAVNNKKSHLQEYIQVQYPNLKPVISDSTPSLHDDNNNNNNVEERHTLRLNSDEGKKEAKEHPIISAIVANELETVKSLIKNANQLCGTVTPLYKACELGRLEIVKILLDNDANPEWRFKATDETPLFMAVKSGSLTICNALLKKGANVNAINKDGKNPLDLAVEAKNVNLVRLLLAYGARPSISDSKPGPVELIADSEKSQISTLLKKAKASPKSFVVPFFLRQIKSSNDLPTVNDIFNVLKTENLAFLKNERCCIYSFFGKQGITSSWSTLMQDLQEKAYQLAKTELAKKKDWTLEELKKFEQTYSLMFNERNSRFGNTMGSEFHVLVRNQRDKLPKPVVVAPGRS